MHQKYQKLIRVLLDSNSNIMFNAKLAYTFFSILLFVGAIVAVHKTIGVDNDVHAQVATK